MNKNIIRLAMSTVTAILLLTASISASAKIVACWKGIAYESHDGGETWTSAGGCAGGPWAIETDLAMDEEETGMTDGEIFESIDDFIDFSTIADRDTARPRQGRTGRNPQTGAW